MTRAALAILVLALAARAAAGEIQHAVAAGETLAAIADRYYGEPELHRSLRLYNELEAGEPAEGATLRIPVASEHTWGSADTWPMLAREHWDDATRFDELRELAWGARGDPAPGEVLVLPALVPYRIREGDTLASLSRLAFGSGRHALILARLNQIDAPERVAVGAVILLPLPHLAPGARASGSGARAEGQRYGEVLSAAGSALDAGDFDTALESLESIESPVAESGTWLDRVQLFEALIRAYVAFDRPSDACRAYRELRRADPGLRWDPDRVSPKVIRMTRGC